MKNSKPGHYAQDHAFQQELQRIGDEENRIAGIKMMAGRSRGPLSESVTAILQQQEALLAELQVKKQEINARWDAAKAERDAPKTPAGDPPSEQATVNNDSLRSEGMSPAPTSQRLDVSKDETNMAKPKTPNTPFSTWTLEGVLDRVTAAVQKCVQDAETKQDGTLSSERFAVHVYDIAFAAWIAPKDQHTMLGDGEFAVKVHERENAAGLARDLKSPYWPKFVGPGRSDTIDVLVSLGTHTAHVAVPLLGR